MNQQDPGDMEPKELLEQEIAKENKKASQSRKYYSNFSCNKCGKPLTDHKSLFCDGCKPRN